MSAEEDQRGFLGQVDQLETLDLKGQQGIKEPRELRGPRELRVLRDLQGYQQQHHLFYMVLHPGNLGLQEFLCQT